METLLIAVFVILFIYLVFYMCRDSDDQVLAPSRPETDSEKSAAVLDQISKLRDRDLHRIKDDLYDLKSIFEKGPDSGKPDAGFSKTAASWNSEEKKQSLKRTLREINQMEDDRMARRKPSFSKNHVLIIQILLILITVLMIIL